VFGILFIFMPYPSPLSDLRIAIAIISEIVSINKAPFYYYLIIWVGSFAITFISLFHDKLTLARSIKTRMEIAFDGQRKPKF
jgi:predicted transporter